MPASTHENQACPPLNHSLSQLTHHALAGCSWLLVSRVVYRCSSPNDCSSNRQTYLRTRKTPSAPQLHAHRGTNKDQAFTSQQRTLTSCTSHALVGGYWCVRWSFQTPLAYTTEETPYPDMRTAVEQPSPLIILRVDTVALPRHLGNQDYVPNMPQT